MQALDLLWKFMMPWCLLIPVVQVPVVACLWRRHASPWMLALMGIPACIAMWILGIEAIYGYLGAEPPGISYTMVVAKERSDSGYDPTVFAGALLGFGVLVAGNQVMLSILRVLFRRR